MKKIYYESPTVEVVDVRVEGGFAYSSEVDSYALWGTENNEGEMGEVDSY